MAERLRGGLQVRIAQFQAWPLTAAADPNALFCSDNFHLRFGPP
jgi:hypothetical protein